MAEIQETKYILCTGLMLLSDKTQEVVANLEVLLSLNNYTLDLGFSIKENV